MNGYAGSVVPPGGMYVRALYDYDADDRTSLSFRQGDIIQVITQLESGWWDGVINGVRGWFPSNYCAVVPRAAGQEAVGHTGDETDEDEADMREQVDENEYEDAESEAGLANGNHQAEAFSGGRDTEEAAFWIPQAMPDGRLFYFNTLTGQSSMELPLETPTSGTENGPRDRTNVYIPTHTQPQPELPTGTYEREDDSEYEHSASEAEGQVTHNQRSFNGVSPATSIDSLNPRSPTSALKPSFGDASFTKPQDTSMTSFTNGAAGSAPLPLKSRKFFDDVQPVTMTWDRLVGDMRRSVERYRQTINAGDRSDFVRRVEDISDHLRLIFAAGSGTTDNHSGNPSIINSNRSLYPHFRETMSRFSKLVLSSHIAATDWPPADSYGKCLREADGVLNGVYGFVEVAKRQRGEEIPRLIPGFVANSYTGGSWQNNGVPIQDAPLPPSLADQDEHEPLIDPVRRLNSSILQRLEDLKSLIVFATHDLDMHLVLRDKLITPLKHRALGDAVCRAARAVLDRYAPWTQTVESLNLSSLSSGFPSATLQDFAVAKQSVYDGLSELVLSCQAIAAPLGDEWSETRNDSLEDRVNNARAIVRNLEQCTSQLLFSLQLICEAIPAAESSAQSIHTRIDSIDHSRSKSTASETTQVSHSGSMLDLPSIDTQNGEDSKPKKVFGELPTHSTMSSSFSEDMPDFLVLDHEGELSYDAKVSPPTLRGGTLAALVEQLTRHDRLDSDFNNTFLLTYQSFTTGNELFEMLVHRWKLQPRQSLTTDEYQTWIDKKQKPIRFRVVNILKSWFDSYWMEGDSEEAKALISRVYSFGKDHVATTNTPGATPLLQAIEQRARAPGQESARKQLVLTLNTSTPQPILPKNMKKLKYLDIDETEFARQLTIIESKLYGKIRPTECLNKTWQKKLAPGEADPAKNVKDLILHSNQLTNWVAQMILAQPTVRNRAVVIKRFVTVADRCRQLNNFSTLTSIISALGTAPIHRLTRTWSNINAKTMATLEAMRKLMGSTKNFSEYRETLAKANPPCIPFFGVYLTDLTFIEDGIPSIIKKTNLINFAKRAKTAEVIRGIQQYQNVPYPLQPVPELQEYILNNMRSAGDVHEMYELSLQVEPREREDEKIARLVDLGLL